MTNKASSFPAAPAIGPLHRYGGRIDALGELPIHALGDSYTVVGSGTILALPTWQPGTTIFLEIANTPTFKNSRTLVLQSGADYTAIARDLVIARSDNDGVWRIYPLSGGGVRSLNGQTGAQVSYFPPQGRITFVTGTPVMMSSQAASTTVYYTPYVGDLVPIYDGTNIVPISFPEVSQVNSDSTKSPSSVATNSCYHLFAWMDGSTPRVTRGFIWTNTTTPGANSALTRVKGILVNSVAITNGPAAQRGTYVGTVCSNGTATFDFIYGASGNGGSAASFGLWNAYNQFPTTTTVTDTQTPYSYAGGTRQAGGSAGNQITFIQGSTGASVLFNYAAALRAGTVVASFADFGVGFDSTTTYTYQNIRFQQPSATQTLLFFSQSGPWNVGVGVHILSANENADGTDAWTFNVGAKNALSATIWN